MLHIDPPSAHDVDHSHACAHRFIVSCASLHR
jgi:hypothetical protein